jgi:hypothetical protein
VSFTPPPPQKKNPEESNLKNEGARVTGDMIENTALHHIPVGTVFQVDDVPAHLSHHICAFLDTELPDHWIGRRGPIPWPLHSSEMSELQSALLMKCLPISSEKLSIALMCIMLLKVPTMRPTEHIRNFVGSNV